MTSPLFDIPATAKAPKPRGGNAVMASREVVDDGDGDGARNYFPTPPWAARAGGELIKQLDPGAKRCWEPACGEGHMAFGLHDFFDEVAMTDIHDYGVGDVLDFLTPEAWVRESMQPDWIVTNPPFALGEAFIRQAYKLARSGVAMLMRLQFLEGAGRHQLWQDCPLTKLGVFCERVPMHKGRWDPDGSTTTAYAWFIFDKDCADGEVRAHGKAFPPRIQWIPPGTKDRLFLAGDRHRFGLPETGGLELRGAGDGA